jgi:hypothetical protein
MVCAIALAAATNNVIASDFRIQHMKANVSFDHLGHRNRTLCFFPSRECAEKSAAACLEADFRGPGSALNASP